jgi:hypothetical protein
MTQDRGREFLLDAMDVDETNFAASASNVMNTFQSTKVVPEVDTYRYSALATMAIGAGNTRDFDPTADGVFPLQELLNDLALVKDKIGSGQVIVTLSAIMQGILAKTAEFKNLTSATVLNQGQLSINLQSINDNPLVLAPSNRLVTSITMRDGRTSGQTAGGWAKGSTAKDINWLITLKTAPIAVSKTDKIRIFTPEQYQKADAWKIDYRKYHDIWVPYNKLPGLFVNTKPLPQAS